MHSAPWTNISSSIGDCAAIFSISFFESSLGSTARQKPMSASIFIPSMVCTEVCVEACRGISGAALRMSEVSPISCKISASALISQAHLTAFIAVSISSSRTRVLSVIYTLTPRAWQYSTACASSSLLKFAALRRAFNSRPPRYTRRLRSARLRSANRTSPQAQVSPAYSSCELCFFLYAASSFASLSASRMAISRSVLARAESSRYSCIFERKFSAEQRLFSPRRQIQVPRARQPELPKCEDSA